MGEQVRLERRRTELRSRRLVRMQAWHRREHQGAHIRALHFVEQARQRWLAALECAECAPAPWWAGRPGFRDSGLCRDFRKIPRTYPD